MSQPENTHNINIDKHISAVGMNLHTFMSIWVNSNVSAPFHIVSSSGRFIVPTIVATISRNHKVLK